jgi:hypothetical protein
MSKNSTLTDVMNGALSGYFTVFAMQPLQVIRTSMMVTYQDGHTAKMIPIIKKISREEGVKGFYRGFWPSLLKTTVGAAFYFTFLEFFKRTYKNLFPEYKIGINFLSSACARGFQSILVNPILVVKTRAEVIGNKQYKSMLDCFLRIRREEGLRGYFQGLNATLVKDVPSSALFYSGYELVKYEVKKMGITNVQSQAAISSCTIAILLTVITNPLDVLRTRVQYHHISHNENHNYKGVVSGVAMIFRQEGIRGLCAGIVPRFIKKGLGSIITWTSYESLKSYK